MRIIPLSEGAFTIDKTKIFIPFDLEKDDLQQRAIGSLLVEIQPFAVITEKDIIILDTGLGFYKNGVMQIHQNCIDNGIDPMKVTKVLLSHLHKDHSGGIADENAMTGSSTCTFPNATYYVDKNEYDFAIEKGSPSYVLQDFDFIKDWKNVVFTEGDGNIDGYIRYEITGAHCPYHRVFWIEENNEIAFFGGDVAPQLQQMKNRFIAKYDFDGKKSMELRQQWREQGQKENWTFLFYHDIKTPVSKL